MTSPANPYSHRSLAEWSRELQTATAADDRYRALLAVNALAEPAEAIAQCRASLRDPDSGVRALAAKRLREWKQHENPSKDPDWAVIGSDLVALLSDSDPDVRFESARAMGQIAPGIREGREVLLKLMEDEGTQPLMLALVITALAERTDTEPESMISRLRELMQHSQAEVRENVSALIAQSSAASVTLAAELIVALDDEEPIVRENAALALGKSTIRSAEVLEGLQRASQDEDSGVALVAARSLEQLQAQ